MSAPSATGFDQGFSAAGTSAGLRRVWELAAPDLPPEVQPFSFVSAALLRHVARALRLSPGQTLADLGCGRGGPGLWLARETGVSLVGVDFSPVAIDQATRRAALFGVTAKARFVVGDLTEYRPSRRASRRRRVDRRLPLRRRPGRGGRRSTPDTPARRAAGADQLAAEGPRRRQAAGQIADRLAAAPARGGLRRRRRGGTARVARPLLPASTGSPLTSVIHAMTPGSPACKTRPGAAFPRLASRAGSS